MKKKPSESDLKMVREHIDKFPRTPSHYTRSSSKREYLDPKLSIQKMYELYVDDSVQNRPDSKPVAAGVYRQVFCTEYNLAFFKPKNDQCQVCSRYALLTGAEKESMKAEYDEHIVRKNHVKQQRMHMAAAFKDNNKFVVTFDLESVLQIPATDVSPWYYTRKLCMNNLTIHNAV